MNPCPRTRSGRATVAVLAALTVIGVAVLVWLTLFMPDRESAEPATVNSVQLTPVDPGPTVPDSTAAGVPGREPRAQPEPEPDRVPPQPVPATDEPPLVSPPTEVEAAVPPPTLEALQARFRLDVADRLTPEQLEMMASDRLLERLVSTVHSLDGAPVPLRFRPLAHVPDLPRLVSDGEGWRLPPDGDPRYAAYRALFERFDAATLAELFDRHEPALERAWQNLGEAEGQRFRSRVIEVLDHLAEFEVPAQRPRLTRPEVLYEFADPALEALSWGRKVLVRIGPEHAAAVQDRAAELADLLAAGSAVHGDSEDQGETSG